MEIKNNKKSWSDNGEEVRSCGYSNYPSIWDFGYVQSLTTQYNHEEKAYTSQRNKLKEKVRIILEKTEDPLVQLEHVDALQRLGVSYHFEDDIDNILNAIYSSNNNNNNNNNLGGDDLYTTALKFRLLRQHQYQIPQEVFNAFKDNETNKFKEFLSKDVMGLLSLYEASYLMMNDEIILEEAREFSTEHLKEFVNNNKEESYVSILVSHALEVPLHWRVPRIEARWFIDLCRVNKESNVDPTILELAILDFNILQSKHQEELKQLHRWWKETGLGEKMKFMRNRLVENVLWNVGMISEPQYGYCRDISTKTFMLLTVVDDTYDSQGTLSELDVFTKALQSWDLNIMYSLPDYMKLSFLAVHNFTNELAYDVLKEQGFHAIKFLKQLWADLSERYLLEAKWYYGGTIPSFNEYIENAWVSIAAPIVLVIAYMCVTNPVTEEAMEFLAMQGYPSIIRQASLIGRLTNDLATNPFELEKGNVPTSIQCYMHETGASEDEARRHINVLVDEAWKKLNRDRAENSTYYSRIFLDICFNLPRMTMWFYDSRDGFGVEYKCATKDCISSLLLNPIPFEGRDDMAN